MSLGGVDGDRGGLCAAGPIPQPHPAIWHTALRAMRAARPWSVVTPQAFIHLPALLGRLTPPDASALRVTPAVLAEWDERARQQGRGPDWRLACEVREAARQALLAQHPPGQDLWVYAYGSLMWDPGIRFAEVRQADLHGWQRRFSYRITGGRGSPECPALMLTLEQKPGCCTGLVFRIPAAEVDAETTLLWRREMLRGGYCPALLPLRTPQGDVPALVFTANTNHPEYVGELPLHETAATVATACGPLGSNRHYLEQLAAQLQALQIDDPYVQTLWQRVQALGG